MIVQAQQCSPEQNLLIAMIERAVSDIAEGNGYAADARRWFNSDFEGLFSFVWCCQVLGVEPQWILKKIKVHVGGVVTKIVSRKSPYKASQGQGRGYLRE